MVENNLASNIRYLRISLNHSQATLGKIIGVTGKTVGMWEREDVGSIRKGTLVVLTRYFSQYLGREITVEDLKFRDFSAESFDSTGHVVLPVGIPPYIPIISRTEAGLSRDYTAREYSEGYGYEFVERPSDVTDKGAYAVRIAGDSMIPALEPGDIIVMSPARSFVSGKICVVRTVSEEVKINRVFRRGEYYILENLKPGDDPLLLSSDRIMSLHPVVWLKKA